MNRISTRLSDRERLHIPGPFRWGSDEAHISITRIRTFYMDVLVH